ncbi:MAG: DUF6512 family protein [Lachnospira sp.]
MNKLKRYTIIGIVFTLIIGTLMHFVYEWSGNNPIVGLIAPVNESVWEHMKLIFFPILIHSLFMNNQLKNEYPCVMSATSFGILLGTLLIPVIFYVYTGILGYNLMILDIGTFVVSVLIAFYAIYKLTISCKLKNYLTLLRVMVLLLAILFILFHYVQPSLNT